MGELPVLSQALSLMRSALPAAETSCQAKLKADLQVGVHLSRASLPLCLKRVSSSDHQDMHLSDGYYEIIGSVRDDLTLKALTSIALGDKLGEW